MAFIKRTLEDHLLVGYRPEPGAAERFWRCPDDETFLKFCALEKAHKTAKTPVPDPAETFGEVPNRSARRAATKKAKAADAAQRKAARAKNADNGYTAAEWIGSEDERGPYFEHAAQMAEKQAGKYQRVLRLYGAEFASKKKMSDVTRSDAKGMLRNMMICPSCRDRAQAVVADDTASRADINRAKKALDNPEQLMVVTLQGQPVEPWDGKDACFKIDEYDEQVSAHWASLKRRTMGQYLGLMRTAWKVAINAGADDVPEDPRCAGVTLNPFVGIKAPHFAEPTDDDDLTESLTFEQLAGLEQAMPGWIEASVFVAAFGMMRRSELLGLNRGMVTWPGPKDEGQAIIRISHVWLKERGKPVGLRPWGKTAGSTREDIYLSPLATEKLRDHFDTHLSTPNPDACAACAAGTGEHTGPRRTNPHRSCDFANDAALWKDPATGKRPMPDYFTKTIFALAVDEAPLTKELLGFQPTPKLLRATGATLLLEHGVEPETVRRMGRWAKLETLLSHYNRIRDASKARAARHMDAAARGELGLPGASLLDPADQARILTRRCEVLEGRITVLEEALRDAGIDPDSVDAVTEVVLPAEVKTAKLASKPIRDDDRVRTAITTLPHRKAILEKLGMSAAKKNYQRLEERSEELGLELPPKWASGSPLEDDDRLRTAITTLPSRKAILQSLDLDGSTRNYQRLEKRAQELGLELPAKRGSADWSSEQQRSA